MKKRFFINGSFSITGIVSAFLLAAFFLPITFAYAPFKVYTRNFKVSLENPALTLSNPAGWIKVASWDKPEIKLLANLDENLEVIEVQHGSSVQVDVKCSKIGHANFEINVPKNCTLDLKCLNGNIEISSTVGSVSAQTTEGEIFLNDLTSNNITAKSSRGAINYKGNLLKTGIYNFSSIENTITLFLPLESAFTLSATTSLEKIDLGEFHLTDSVKHERRLSGKHSGGGASLNLVTHRGKIRLAKLSNK